MKKLWKVIRITHYGNSFIHAQDYYACAECEVEAIASVEFVDPKPRESVVSYETEWLPGGATRSGIPYSLKLT